MTNARLRELQLNMNADLTAQEFAEGWHFCHEWDLDPVQARTVEGFPGRSECEWCGYVKVPES